MALNTACVDEIEQFCEEERQVITNQDLQDTVDSPRIQNNSSSFARSSSRRALCLAW